MKITLTVFIGVMLAIGLYFAFLSVSSRKPPVLGLDGGKLLPCPGTPNCVCSEYPDSRAYIDPLAFTMATGDAWRTIKRAVKDMGGDIKMEHVDYLHASFTTRLFRYIDDVELRLDVHDNVIHVRSASRVGTSDFGANKKRVKRMRALFNSAADH